MSEAHRSYRTPLARVRGRGSAKSGTGHFIAQRATAVALLVLLPWFAISAAVSINGYTDALAFVRQPLNSLGIVLLIVAGAYHMMIGMQVVIEDYISKHGTRTALVLLNTFFCILLAAAGILAVLQINFGFGI